MTQSAITSFSPEDPLQLSAAERSLAARMAVPSAGVLGCCRPLEMGFFFDGTRNNLKYDEVLETHSNVARLYQAFDARPDNDGSNFYRYRTYVPGVGTEFRPEVGDAGIGMHAVAGAAAGWGGEARINWALLQLQNNLHRHWFRDPLSVREEDLLAVRRMSTDMSLPSMQLHLAGKVIQPKGAEDVRARGAVSAKQSFQSIFSTHWRATNTDGRRRKLAERRKMLHEKLLPLIPARLPKIDGIRLYVYGFSRGAAAARTFVHWLRDLCDEPTGPMTVCGLPMKVEFLGLFDTVASVGAAQGVLDDLATGHGGWAQRRDMRIPDASIVTRCLHLVAAHEVRGSFPLELASGPNVTEEVFPGVHSDLGGGYAPNEQARGEGDAQKLSQLPLARMYRASLAAGVPLRDINSLPDTVKKSFRISPVLVKRFNAYIAQCQSGARSTRELMKDQYRLYLRWRKFRLGKHGELNLGSAQDRVDILGADRELKQEAELLEKIDGVQRVRGSAWLSGGYLGMLDDAGILVARGGAYSLIGLLGGYLHPAWATFDDVPGGTIASISPYYSGMATVELAYAQELAARKKYEMWREVKNAWQSNAALHADIVSLFDLHVHDSRAWFKPLGQDDDVWEQQKKSEIERLLKKEKAWNESNQGLNSVANAVRGVSLPLLVLPRVGPAPLSDEEKATLASYRARLKLSGKIEGDVSKDSLPLQESGREIYALWGYLRWRGMFEDNFAEFSADYPRLASASRQQLIERQKYLERQLRVLREREASLRKRASDSAPSITLGGGGGGGAMMGYMADAQALFAEIQPAERELKAVNVFIDEIGPLSWWESL